MKKMKKIFALLIAMVMVLGMSTMAFAATLDVQNAIDGQKYTAYKLLNYELDGETWTYYLTSEQEANKTFLEGLGFEFTVDSTTNNFVVTNSDKLDAETIATALKTAEIVSIGDPVEVTASGSSASFTDLPTGYYFITSTTGSLVTLGSWNDGETVFDKNKEIIPDKTATGAVDSGTTDENDVNSANIGDEIEYTVAFTIYPGAENVVFTDTMSKGLTLGAETDLSVTGADGGYTVDTFEENTDEGSIKISFTKAFLDSITEDTDVTITYKATINSDALEENNESNTGTITYGHNSDIVRTDIVKTYLGNLTIFKHNSSGEGLGGAEFSVTGENGEIKVSEVKVGEYNVDPEGTATITSDDEGNVVIHGLAAGDYTIEETKAPENYNILNGTTTATVEVNSTAEVTATVTDGEADILNQAGSELPSTGGIGTTIFYVVGTILVIGAGVVLVTRRRMNVQ